MTTACPNPGCDGRFDAVAVVCETHACPECGHPTTRYHLTESQAAMSDPPTPLFEFAEPESDRTGAEVIAENHALEVDE